MDDQKHPTEASMNFTQSVNSSLSELTSSNDFVVPCFGVKESIFVFVAVSITNLFLLIPIFILVVYLRCQQWRRQHSTSSAMSHADIFLYHSIAMDLYLFLGYTLFFFGSHFNLFYMWVAGYSFWTVAFFGQALFHVLTCVERYLAVVKPITYQGLKQAGGARIRKISTGCVWLLSFLYLIVTCLCNFEIGMILYLCIMSFLLFVICFCSISVLCVLKHPGPGEEGGNIERVDKSKQRAFYTIMAIMGALLLRFGGILICYIIQNLIPLTLSTECVVWFSILSFALPSSLVLPLLFLKRAGRLQCLKNMSESG